MRSCWSKMDPLYNITSVLIKETGRQIKIGECPIKTQMPNERQPHNDRRLEFCRNVKDCQQPPQAAREAWKRCSLSALQKEPILLTLEPELVAFRMMRTLISVLILGKIFKKKKSLFPVGISLSFLPIPFMYLEAEGCFR